MAVNNVYIARLLKLETTCNVLLKKLPVLIRFDNRSSIYRPSPKSYGMKIITGYRVISFPKMPVFGLKLTIQSRAPKTMTCIFPLIVINKTGKIVQTSNTFWCSSFNYYLCEHILEQRFQL